MNVQAELAGRTSSYVVVALLALTGFLPIGSSWSQTGTDTRVSYEQVIERSRYLLERGELAEAYVTASAAMTVDDSRWEAYGLAALALGAQGNNAEAVRSIDQALARAPAPRKASLHSMRRRFSAEAATDAQALRTSTKLSSEGRRRFNELMQIANRADKAALQRDRIKLLRDFMSKSAEFIIDYPNQANVWMVRAVAAIELDYPGSGWLAGRRLKQLGLMESNDERNKRVLAELSRKGWLGGKRSWRDWPRWTMAQARRAAEEGDAEAQFAMGDWFARGMSDLPKSDVEAVNWYRRAAEQGYADAQFGLGMAYDYGLGVGKSESTAVQWYGKAAAQGFAPAQNNLGKVCITWG